MQAKIPRVTTESAMNPSTLTGLAQEASSGWYSLDRSGCPDCSGKGPAARAWAAAHTAAEVETAEVTRAEAAARAAETPEETEARGFREEAARAEVVRQAGRGQNREGEKEAPS